jgi:CHAT domain-containing protein
MLRMLIVVLLGLSLIALAFADEPKPQWQRMLTGDHAKKADELEKQIAKLEVAENYAEAISLQEELLALRTKVQGADHWETVDATSYLVALKKVAALPEEKRAEWRKGVQAEGDAIQLEQKGQFARALPLKQKLLDMCRLVLGEEHPNTASKYNSLAYNLRAQGNYAEAGPLDQKSLDIKRRVLGEEHPNTAVSYNNVASNLDAQGEYAAAAPFYQKALETNRKILGEEHAYTVRSYNNVALNLNYQRKYAEATPLFQKSLDNRRKVRGEESPDTAIGYNNLARNLNGEGKYAAAEPLLQKALEIWRKALGEEHPNTATGYNNVAANLEDQGKYAAAGPLFQNALDIRRKVLGEEHPDIALSYKNVVLNLSAEGKYAEAQKYLESSAASYEAARQNVARGGLERAAYGAARSPYRTLAAIRSHLGLSTPSWEVLEADLARGLLDEMATRRGSGLTPDAKRRRDELRDRVNPINTRILARATRSKRTDAEIKELDQLIEQRRGLEKSLIELAVTGSRREVASLAQVQTALPADAAFVAWVDVSDKSGGLQEHWGCVARPNRDARWERLQGSGPDGKWTKEDTDLPARFREALVKAAPPFEIDALAKKLYGQRFGPLSEHLAGVKRLFVAPVNQMAGIPIEALTDKYTVSYSPSGTYLARLKDRERPHGSAVLAVGDPLLPALKEKPQPTALPPAGLLITQVVPGGNAAKARLQNGDVLVSYAGTDLTSSEQLGKLIDAQAGGKSVAVKVWREGQEKLNEREVARGKLSVALAREPAREAIRARRQTDQMLAKLSRGEEFTELPGTQVEIARLAGLFDGKNVTTLTRASATEQRLEAMRKADELKKYRYLHFATHGKANNFRSFDSALILTRPEKIPEPRAGEPWLDGRLTAAEVLEYWKLDAELVTLSACESALGRQGGGDGLLGFAQAFLLAGSRSVCLTLWQVDDTATVLLMDRFYRNLLGKREDKAKPMGKASALYEAKHWLRNLTATEALDRLGTLTNGVVRGERPAREEMKTIPMPKDAGKDYKPYSHPRYWAAFILIGDPD